MNPVAAIAGLFSLSSLLQWICLIPAIGGHLGSSGKKVAIVAYFIDLVVDLKDCSQWWSHQLYWDQNTRAARSGGFFASTLTRSVPFALFFAASRLGDGVGLAVVGGSEFILTRNGRLSPRKEKP